MACRLRTSERASTARSTLSTYQVTLGHQHAGRIRAGSHAGTPCEDDCSCERDPFSHNTCSVCGISQAGERQDVTLVKYSGHVAVAWPNPEATAHNGTERHSQTWSTRHHNTTFPAGTSQHPTRAPRPFGEHALKMVRAQNHMFSNGIKTRLSVEVGLNEGNGIGHPVKIIVLAHKILPFCLLIVWLF